jgi:hypothetical protein
MQPIPILVFEPKNRRYILGIPGFPLRKKKFYCRLTADSDKIENKAQKKCYFKFKMKMNQ